MRWCGTQKMHMVLVCSQALHLDFVALFNLAADPQKFGGGLCIKQRLSVLDGKHEMVVQVIDIVPAAFERGRGAWPHALV